MRLYLIVALYVSCLLDVNPVNANSVIQFYSGNLSSVKALAQSEDKPLMIHFTASWCMPCEWMEKTTYQDPALVQFVNTHFVAVKLDLDEPDGTNAFSHYGGKVLPTVVLLDQKGNSPALHEAIQSGDELLGILEDYYKAHQLSLPVPNVQPSPQAVIFPKKSALVTETKPLPSTTPAERPVAEAAPEPSDALAALAPRDGSYYTIICGRFSDYEKAVRCVRQLERRQNQSVNLRARDGMFVVYLGTFRDWNAAQKYADKLHFVKTEIGVRERG